MTEDDRLLIAQARELGPPLRASDNARDRLVGWVLKELADRVEQLVKDGSADDGGETGDAC